MERLESQRVAPYPRNRTSARTIYPERTNSFHNNNVPPVYYIPMEQYANTRLNEKDEKYVDDLPTYEQAILASKKTFEQENNK